MKYDIDKLTVNELFCGIGSQRKALERLGISHEVVGIAEIDKYAIQSYESIFGKTYNYGDISKVESLNYADLWTYSFPCLTGDTLILTSEGYRKLVDIKIGDLVVGHDGNLHKVNAFYNQGCKDTYKINAMGMDSIRCTSNHKFYVREKYYEYEYRGNFSKEGWKKNTRVRKFKPPKWVECKDLNKNYYLGMPINDKSEMVYWDGVEYTRWKHSHNKLPLNNPNFWYIVGRYLGDGWTRIYEGSKKISYTTIICCGKHEIEELENKLTLFKYTKSEESTVYKLIISNKELTVFLTQFGKGALGKYVPGFVLNLPVKFLQKFVEGYLESDGCCISNYYNGSSISRELIYGLTRCVAKVYKRPFSVYHTKRKPKCIIDNRLVNQNDSYSFRFHMDSYKQDKAFYEDGYIWYPINSITPTNKKENVYDIEVDEVHSFIANNCITHNCTDLSVAGTRKGFIDEDGNQTRSGLLYEVERLLDKAKETNTLPKLLLMENVKNLVGKEFKPNFDKFLCKLTSLGYNNYWQVLNSKDYGIPQNRERVFVVSIRKDIDKYGYVFPSKMKLSKCLKDILENEIEDRYYLNTHKLETFVKNNKFFEIYSNSQTCLLSNKGTKFEKCTNIANSLLARDYKGFGNQSMNAIIELGFCKYPNSDKKHQSNTVYSDIGLSPTLNTSDEVKIIEYDKYSDIIQVGNILDTERFGGNPQDGRVYSDMGQAPTLNTSRPPIILSDELEKSAEIEKVGNIYESDSQNENIYAINGISPTLLSGETNNRNNGGIGSSNSPKVLTENLRIRKLTPLECWRLMGFDDEDFNKAQSSDVSDTQLYKQAGNSIVVDCLYYIFKSLLVDIPPLKKRGILG